MRRRRLFLSSPARARWSRPLCFSAGAPQAPFLSLTSGCPAGNVPSHGTSLPFEGVGLGVEKRNRKRNKASKTLLEQPARAPKHRGGFLVFQTQGSHTPLPPSSAACTPTPRLALPAPPHPRGPGGRVFESGLIGGRRAGRPARAPDSPAAGGAPLPWEPDGPRLPAGDRSGALAHAGPRLCSRAAAETCAADDGSRGLGRRGADRLPLVRATPAAQLRAALRAPGRRQPPRQQVTHRAEGAEVSWAGVGGSYAAGFSDGAQDHRRLIVVSSFGGLDE